MHRAIRHEQVIMPVNFPPAINHRCLQVIAHSARTQFMNAQPGFGCLVIDLDNLCARKQRGNKPALSPGQQETFKTRLLAGPTGADGGVCTLRGKDIQGILERSFGVRYSLNGVYNLLWRLGYTSLAPRPRHEEQDRKIIEDFKRRAPLL